MYVSYIIYILAIYLRSVVGIKQNILQFQVSMDNGILDEKER